MIIDWINSTAARLGLGPPEWIVIAAILLLIMVGMFETGAAPAHDTSAVLSRTERRMLIGLGILVALAVSAFALRLLAS